MWTVASALFEVRKVSALNDNPALDAYTFVGRILGKNSAWLFAHPEALLTPEQTEALEAGLTRLGAGEPLPYVLGEWEFYGRNFEVAPGVLIPRPETELLVDRALTWLRAHPNRRQAVDIGCGSGCIGVTLAAEIPDLHLLAVDLSLTAVKISQHNSFRYGVEDRLQLICSDLLNPLVGQMDLVVANPPYIPTGVLVDLDVLKHEPRLALDGGKDGLDVIRRILQGAMRWLSQGGLLLVEIESGQREGVMQLAEAIYPQADFQVLVDLAGRDRLLQLEREV